MVMLNDNLQLAIGALANFEVVSNTVSRLPIPLLVVPGRLMQAMRKMDTAQATERCFGGPSGRSRAYAVLAAASPTVAEATDASARPMLKRPEPSAVPNQVGLLRSRVVNLQQIAGLGSRTGRAASALEPVKAVLSYTLLTAC